MGSGHKDRSMALLHKNSPLRGLYLEEREEPQLYREVYPYTKVGRIEFDDTIITPRPAEPCFITDTTFRDGQQARPPYTVKQIARIYDLLHKLGGKNGLIQATEFFMYSPKDRRAAPAAIASRASRVGYGPTPTIWPLPGIWILTKWAC